VRLPGHDSRLGIGDRVRFSGAVRTVIGLAGTVVRLADPGGMLTEVTLVELVTAGDFERVGVRRPRRCRRGVRWTVCRKKRRRRLCGGNGTSWKCCAECRRPLRRARRQGLSTIRG
jgi:hypothetical protein